MRRHLAWMFVALGLALACGGRFQRDGEGDDGSGGVSTGQGGSATSQAGASSRSGASSSGGSVQTAGTVGVGASPGTAGVGTGGGFACNPIVCAPGYVSVPTPGGSCFECRVDDKTCDVQRKNYASYREALLFKHTPYKCTTASDCFYYYDINECQVYSCGALVDVATQRALDAELSAFARANCDPACPAPPVPPCEPPSEPACFKGYCE